jgi:hypothetical protein
MCIPVASYNIEREWKHSGLSCAVVQAREAGNRCGYVRVPPGHPEYGKNYNDVEVSVHGGLTFAELEPCTEHSDGQGWWFGFDCAHFQDAMYDPSVNPDTPGLSEEIRNVLTTMHHMNLKYLTSGLTTHYWTEAEVVAETERLAEQLAEVKP